MNQRDSHRSRPLLNFASFFFCFVVGFRHRRFHLFGLGFFVAFSFLSSLRIAALIGGRALVRRENPRRDSGPTFDYICPSPGFHSLLFLVFLPFSFRFFFFFFFFFFLRFCIQRWRPLWRKWCEAGEIPISLSWGLIMLDWIWSGFTVFKSVCFVLYRVSVGCYWVLLGFTGF